MNTFQNYSFEQGGNNYEVFRPEHMAFDELKTGGSRVTFNGAHEVYFDKRSPITAAISTGMGIKAAEQALSESVLFTINDELAAKSISTRPGTNHFVHDQSAVQKMIEHIGPDTRMTKHAYQYNDLDSEGGTFDVNIGYKWSPFQKDIATFTDITRLVCDNLMEMNNPVMNYLVPMINAWEDNIAISNEALRHAFDTKIRPLMAKMVDTKISMWQLSALNNVMTRLLSSDENIALNKWQDLDTVAKRIQDTMHTFNGLAENVPTSYTRLIDAPVSTFDAYNMLTEINSHYLLEPDNKVTALTNDLVFGQRERSQNVDILDAIQKVANEESFENVDRAFFGVAH